MPDPVNKIVESLFTRAAADTSAAPLADGFARAYREGQWTVDRLDQEVRAVVDAHRSNAEGAAAQWSGGSL